jgi:adenine-specific DNA-methyltransferase
LLTAVEETRLRVSKNTEAKRKSQLGQFLTPARMAQFMTSLFTSKETLECRLLDAGAGIGSLSSAFLERCIDGGFKFKHIDVAAFELDGLIHDENFRRSSGHTQVNATDLKMMKYPSRKALIALGEWAKCCGEPYAGYD